MKEEWVKEKRRTDIVGLNTRVKLFQWNLLWGGHGCVSVAIV